MCYIRYVFFCNALCVYMNINERLRLRLLEILKGKHIYFKPIKKATLFIGAFVRR